MVVGSSNNTYDQYQSFEDHTAENIQTKEENIKTENNVDINEDGYTDVYPIIDTTENTEEDRDESKVNINNTLNKKENNINYIDLDVTNNNIEIKDNKIIKFCKKNFGRNYKLITCLIMIELLILTFILYRNITSSILPVNMSPEMVVNNLSRFN
jgi:hypothetical protein